MELALDGPLLVIGVLGLVSFFRFIVPIITENRKSNSGKDEDDF